MTPTIPRAHQRRRVLWHADLHVGGRSWECKVVDVSPGGVKIMINDALAINSRVIIAIERAGTFPGEVLWQNQEFAGIQFLEEPEVVEERLHCCFAMGET